MAAKVDPAAPMVISWKAFWTAFGVVATAGIGYLTPLTQLHPLVTVGVAVGVAAVFMIGAGVAVHGAPMFAEVSDIARSQMLRWMAAAAAAHVLWVVTIAVRPDLYVPCAVVLLVLACVEYWLCRAHEFLLTKLRRPTGAELAEAGGNPDDKVTKQLRRSLDKARLSAVKIVGWEPLEHVPGLGVTLQEPSQAAAAEAGGKSNTRLGPQSSEAIAIGLSEVLGAPLMSDWVSIRKDRAAGRHRLVIVTEDVMNRVYAYEDDLKWLRSTDPVLIGYDIEGRPHHARIDKHGQMSGATECVAGDTRIYLPLTDEHVRIDELAARGEPITVLAWTGTELTPAQTAAAPFLKGTAQLYEVQCSDGATLRATSQHRFLTPQGWRRLADVHVGQQLAAVPHAAPGAADDYPSSCSEGDGRCPDTPAGCLDRCSTCLHPYDLPLQPESTSGQECPRQPGGAHVRNRCESKRGDLAYAQGCTPAYQLSSHHASSGSSLPGCLDLDVRYPVASWRWTRSCAWTPSRPQLCRWTSQTRIDPAGGHHLSEFADAPNAVGHLPQGFEPASPATGTGSPRSRHEPPQRLQLPQLIHHTDSAGTTLPLRSATAAAGSCTCGSAHHDSPESAELADVRTRPSVLFARSRHPAGRGSPSRLQSPCNGTRWVTVRSIRPAGIGQFFDMTVPGPANYVAEGLIHHNSGKSSLANVELANATLFDGAVVMAGGTEKFYDLIGPWVEPYLNTDHAPPFEMVASGINDVVELLVGLMKLARWRQRQPMTKRQGFVRIIWYHDEASFTLRNTSVKAMYDGQEQTASQLTGKAAQAWASALMYQRLISQRGVNTHFGDAGGDVTANAATAAAFRTKDQADVGRMMGLTHYGLAVPRHRGEFWYTDEETEPVRLKAPYIQTVDPSKPVLHNGATVADVAWSRRHFPRQLDEPSEAYLSEVCPVYANRHRTVTAAYLSYLTGSDTPHDDTGDGDSVTGELSPQEAGRAVAEAKYQELVQQYTPTATTQSVSRGGVAVLADRRTRADRIATIVRNADTPLVRGEIIERLRNSGDDAGEQVVQNALGKLTKDGTVERRDGEGYVAH